MLMGTTESVASDQNLPEPIAADQALHEAIAAYRAGKLDEAEALCNRILEQQPDHIGSLQLLAVVAANKAAPRRGIELMEKAIALYPDSVDSYIELARLLKLEKRDSDAITALKKAIAIEPNSAGAYNDLGLVYFAQGDVAKAVGCYDRAIAIDPNLAFAHFNRGVALEQQGKHAKAIESFRRVVAIDPDFAEAHAKLGNLLLFEHDGAAAIECLRRAAALRPDSVLGLTSQAKILMEEEKAAAAEELVRRAIDLQPRNSYAHCLLGTILMELGRFHDAAASFDIALALNRRETAAYYNLVNVKKLTEADRPLLAQMEWMLKEYELAEDDQANLHFSLGKAYDDLGEYENAIEHFDQANRVRHRRTSFNPPWRKLVADRVIERFTPEFFSRNAVLGSDCEVPILVLGMPRSGTTLVEQILSSHPEVAAGGEIPFWAECVSSFRADATGAIDPAWVSRMARDYQSLATGISPTALRVTDKSPHNFHILGLIHVVFPRARIIHCRRHPVDTCLSIYFQDFARKMDFAYDRDDLVAYYRQYQKLMAHWRSVLPADRFLELQYETLVDDREAMTREMIAFCSLDWDDACLHSERNPRSVRTASVWQARQPVYKTSVARWRRYEPWLGALRELLPDADRTLRPGCSAAKFQRHQINDADHRE
jgi:tetratricopeptide (TPR) repeat protein